MQILTDLFSVMQISTDQHRFDRFTEIRRSSSKFAQISVIQICTASQRPVPIQKIRTYFHKFIRMHTDSHRITQISTNSLRFVKIHSNSYRLEPCKFVQIQRFVQIHKNSYRCTKICTFSHIFIKMPIDSHRVMHIGADSHIFVQIYLNLF